MDTQIKTLSQFSFSKCQTNKSINTFYPLWSELEWNLHFTSRSCCWIPLSEFLSLSQRPSFLKTLVLEGDKSLKNPCCEVEAISLLWTLTASFLHFHQKCRSHTDSYCAAGARSRSLWQSGRWIISDAVCAWGWTSATCLVIWSLCVMGLLSFITLYHHYRGD